jgi:hypothetical protein
VSVKIYLQLTSGVPLYGDVKLYFNWANIGIWNLVILSCDIEGQFFLDFELWRLLRLDQFFSV